MRAQAPHPSRESDSGTNINLLFLAAISLSLLSLIFLSGCVQPNSNLSYGACCMQSNSFYTCQVRTDANGTQQRDSNGNLLIDGCGPCIAVAKNGTVYNSSGPTDAALCTNNCNFKQSNCTNFDGKNTCYLVDKNMQTTNESVGPICMAATDPCVQNNCTAMVYGKPLPSPKRSINSQSVQQSNNPDGNAFKQDAANQKTGLVGRIMQFSQFNTRLARLLKSPDWSVNTLRLGLQGQFSDYDRARFYLPPSDYFCPQNNPNAIVDRYTAYLDGLSALPPFRSYYTVNYATTCSPGHKKPPYGGWYSTCTCTPSSPPAPPCGKDFMGSSALDAEDMCNSSCTNFSRVYSTPNFKNPLSLCRLEPASGANLSYFYCDVNPGLKFTIADPSDQLRAYLSCQKACSYSQYRTCSQNQDLLTYNANLHPNIYSPSNWPPQTPPAGSIQPFIDIDQYAKALANAYPTPTGPAWCPALVALRPDPAKEAAMKNDPRNYYKCLLPEPNSAGANQTIAAYGITADQYNTTYMSEGIKPGPAGGKVFECTGGGDCLSGICDKSTYSRTSCFLKDGSAVDCACRWVTNCKLAYQCSGYEARSIRKDQCEVNLNNCQEAQGGSDYPVLMCEYRINPLTPQTANPPIHGLRTPYASSGNYVFNDGRNGYGILHIEEFNKYIDAAVADAELATVQRPSTSLELCPSRVRRPCASSTEQGCYVRNTNPPDVSVLWQHDGDSDVYQNIPAYTPTYDACPSGGTLSNVSGWKDTPKAFGDYLRDSSYPSRETFALVPTQQAVAGPGGAHFITTSRYVTWQNDNCYFSLSGYTLSGSKCPADQVRFPLFQACNMSVNSEYFNKAAGSRSYPYQDAYQAEIYNARGQDAAGSAFDVKYVDGYSYDPNNNDTLYSYGGSDPYRIDKTWAIYSFGACQVQPSTPSAPAVSGKSPPPVVFSYGMCRSCGTLLSMAYQPVKDSPLAFPYDFNGYCPSGCKKYIWNGFLNMGPKFSWCAECPSSYPAQTFSQFARGSPAMYPDFGFLADKINEYQSSNILPVLDVRNYHYADGGSTVVRVPFSNLCQTLGGKRGGSGAINQNGGVYQGSAWDCTLPAQPDWLLAYLNKNHSAAVLIVANLPPAAIDPAVVQAEVDRSAKACPNCLRALEYVPLLTPSDVTGADYNYPSALNDSVASYTNVSFNPLRVSTPPEWLSNRGKKPDNVRQVDMIVLELDMSGVDMTNETTVDNAVLAYVNLSRRLLQHVGWPTIWKINYRFGMYPSALTNDVLYRRIIAHEREMTLAGVSGVLMPAMDNGDPDGHITGPPTEQFGRLLPNTGGLSGSSLIRASGTPFCALQNASAEFLHPKMMVGTQKILAKNNCSCLPCSDMDLLAGNCNNKCYDGLACEAPGGGTSAGSKCEPYCVRNSFCQNNLCNGTQIGSKTTTCTALRPTNLPPVSCGANNALFPKCDVLADAALKDIAALPQAPQLIGGLPPGQGCCLSQNRTYYTYRSAGSAATSAEPVIFPGYGANTTDCGRVPDPGDPYSDPSANCAVPPAPLSNVMWTCTPPR